MKHILTICFLAICCFGCTPTEKEDVIESEITPTATILVPVSTATLKPTLMPTSTITPHPATQTQIAIEEFESKVTSYQEIGWKELADNIELHIGENVRIRGKIVLIENEYELQINVVDINIAAQMQIPFLDLETGDFVTIYGTVKESKCFMVGGGEVCYPVLIDALYRQE